MNNYYRLKYAPLAVALASSVGCAGPTILLGDEGVCYVGGVGMPTFCKIKVEQNEQMIAGKNVIQDLSGAAVSLGVGVGAAAMGVGGATGQLADRNTQTNNNASGGGVVGGTGNRAGGNSTQNSNNKLGDGSNVGAGGSHDNNHDNNHDNDHDNTVGAGGNVGAGGSRDNNHDICHDNSGCSGTILPMSYSKDAKGVDRWSISTSHISWSMPRRADGKLMELILNGNQTPVRSQGPI